MVEGATFIKPYCMAKVLRDHGVGRLIYLDNDIVLYGPLDSVFGHLKQHSFVLTPHMVRVAAQMFV